MEGKEGEEDWKARGGQNNLNVGGRNWGKRKNGQRHLSMTRLDSQQTHAHTSAHLKHVHTSIHPYISNYLALQLQQSQSRIRRMEKEKVTQLVVHTTLVLHVFNQKTFRFPCIHNFKLGPFDTDKKYGHLSSSLKLKRKRSAKDVQTCDTLKRGRTTHEHADSNPCQFQTNPTSFSSIWIISSFSLPVRNHLCKSHKTFLPCMQNTTQQILFCPTNGMFVAVTRWQESLFIKPSSEHPNSSVQFSLSSSQLCDQTTSLCKQRKDSKHTKSTPLHIDHGRSKVGMRIFQKPYNSIYPLIQSPKRKIWMPLSISLVPTSKNTSYDIATAKAFSSCSFRQLLHSAYGAWRVFIIHSHSGCPNPCFHQGPACVSLVLLSHTNETTVRRWDFRSHVHDIIYAQICTHIQTPYTYTNIPPPKYTCSWAKKDRTASSLGTCLFLFPVSSARLNHIAAETSHSQSLHDHFLQKSPVRNV